MKHILVTGDLVLDYHLYSGTKMSATDFNEPGTKYAGHPGGAALTAMLLSAAADASGIAWDKADRAWKTENEKRQKDDRPPLPRPENLPEERPTPAFDTELALSDKNLRDELPKDLHSFGVWTAHPARQNAKEMVWRIADDNHFGFGSADSEKKSAYRFKPTDKALPEKPALTVIDDGGILFRNEVCRPIWPDFRDNAGGQYLLKMSHPLCRADLWAELAPVMERLTVVVSARDLRREDAQINARLSWERCVEDTINTFESNSTAAELLKAAHIVVNFGSAGALWVEGGSKAKSPTYHLMFDPRRLEGDYSSQFEGTVYGFQTCFAAGIGFHLMMHQVLLQGSASKITSEYESFSKAMQLGIASGLNARRKLLELGHGMIEKRSPGFPISEIGNIIARNTTGYASSPVPLKSDQDRDCQWSILSQLESADDGKSMIPLIGLAELTAIYGPSEALSDIPAYQTGDLFTVDRSEIESFRTIEALIKSYTRTKVQKKPLSIGVFGPPGAGKSFGVKAMAEAILGPKSPFIEFNLSQFKGPEELIGAFHRVRDAVLTGTTPVAFWDEFDSQNYKWLQYLLAPMQDGTFQEGQITHPIGKCIFIFAGGTSASMESFGIHQRMDPPEEELIPLIPELREHRLCKAREESDRYTNFKLLKGPDFISRLHGFLNVLGPNRRSVGHCNDATWPIRRSLMLRGILRLKDDATLNIDPGLLHALLGVSTYHHGSRSLAKILETVHDGSHHRLYRSDLPPQPLLERETDAEDFLKLLCQGDAFRNHPNLDDLAAAVHFNFLEGAEKSEIEAERTANPGVAWKIDPSIKKSYEQLTPDAQASNRAAAQRIPNHLALIGFAVKQREVSDDDSWKAILDAAIRKHLDRIAKAEHIGWCAERISSGWTYASERDNSLKHHPLLVPWVQLTLADKDKDRSSALSIPKLLETAGFKAVPISLR